MNVLLITWRYMGANRLKTLILTVCLTITIFLPFALHQLIGFYERDMLARADATPLVIGAKGDRYDLVLKTLYFNGDSPESLSQADLDAVTSHIDGTAIPLYLEFTARGKPVVGAGLEYFTFRNLTPAQGQLPQRIGDCVIGSRAAGPSRGPPSPTRAKAPARVRSGALASVVRFAGAVERTRTSTPCGANPSS